MKNITYREELYGEHEMADYYLLKASNSKHVFYIRFIANMTANFAYDSSQMYINQIIWFLEKIVSCK